MQVNKAGKFISVGLLTYFLAVFLMSFGTDYLGLHYALSYGVTQVVIFLINFNLARYWIFQASDENVATQGVRFFSAVALFRFTDWLVFLILNLLFEFPHFFAIFLSMSIVFPMKFFIYDKKVFREH